MKSEFREVKWCGDHYSMEAILNLHEDIGIMEHENGYDLELDLNGKFLKIRLNQWVELRNDELFVVDK